MKNTIFKKALSLFLSVLMIASVLSLTVGAADCTHANISGWQTSQAKHWKECTDCHETVEEENHIPDSTWTYDDDYHWVTCTKCGYGPLKKARHSYGTDGYCVICHRHNHGSNFTWQYNDTEHYKVCNVCGATFDRATHKKIETWLTDENTHWQACECGKKYPAAHSYGDDCKCDTCGYYKHVAPATYSKDKTYHWKLCTECGYIIELKKHEYENGVCKDCGYNPSVPQHFDGQVDWVWKKTSTEHWHSCSNAACTTKHYQGAHDLDKYGKCKVCDYKNGPSCTPTCPNHPSFPAYPNCPICPIIPSNPTCPNHPSFPAYPNCPICPIIPSNPTCPIYPGCIVRPNRSYVISVSGNVGGTLSPAGNAVIVAGESMTYNFTPKDGFGIAKVIVDGVNIGKVSSYTFRNITANHTLQVVFEKLKMPFLDVYTADWYYDDVLYVWNNDIMQGTAYTTFDPNGDITRAMIVTMLWRLEGEPTSTGMQFNDVASGSYYANAVRWAAKNGIVCGYGDNTFKPNQNITREELATILYRYLEFKGEGFVGSWSYRLPYEDASDISDWAIKPVSFLAMKNIIVTDSATKLNPDVDATRAETAVCIHRICEFLNG